MVERALVDGASGRGVPVRPAAGRPRRVGGMGGVQVSVRRIMEGSTDLSKQRSVARDRCHPAADNVYLDLTGNVYHPQSGAILGNLLD